MSYGCCQAQFCEFALSAKVILRPILLHSYPSASWTSLQVFALPPFECFLARVSNLPADASAGRNADRLKPPPFEGRHSYRGKRLANSRVLHSTFPRQ